MQYRLLGSTPLRLSRLCLGTGQLGDGEGGGATHRAAVGVLERALELGVNFFDTSEWYGQGRSEELLGEVLAPRRSEVCIATKVGLHLYRGIGIRDSRPERITAHIDRALARLRTDYVDLYQIHWPDPEVPLEESWEAMCRLWREGKARYIGVSNYRAADIARCLAVGPVHSLQACFHMFRRELAATDLPFCVTHGIGTMIWGPLAHGLLTGRYTRQSPPALPADDWRAAMPIMRGRGFLRCADTIEQLVAFSRDRAHTITELALAWTLAQPGVTAVVTGARSVAQLDAQVGGANWILSAEERSAVDAILAGAPSWSDLGGDPEYGGHHVLSLAERPALP